MSGLKLLTFDLDDTLWDVRPIIIKAEKRMREWLVGNVPGCIPYLEADNTREVWKSLLRERPELKHHLGELRRLVIESIVLQSGLGLVEAKEISTKALAIFLDGRHQVVYFEGALEVLSVLRQHFILGALTNGNANIKRLGLDSCFAFAHTASSVGLGKPYPRIFQQALKTADVDAREALHVGDHPDDDIAGADAVGMYTLHFRSSELENPSPPSEVTPTMTAETMPELQQKILQFSEQLADRMQT